MIIISGGQTGADEAGWRATLGLGIQTGGYMPEGFMTEAGPRPEFRRLYGAVQLRGRAVDAGDRYRERTRRNAEWADLTLWFTLDGKTESPGYYCTATACRDVKRPLVVISPHGTQTPEELAAVMHRHYAHGVVNIAGSRESRSPGIGQWVEKLLTAALVILIKESTK